ncbi:hypothetical protein BSPWISOXPB_10941 [uncultured Gammaproteobacteria bacterium]|jgi:hypothetical protein|nr:hypothetical protein BSPWISOXPB_10941 [uncultured Gammaproteobacteria bacterium]
MPGGKFFNAGGANFAKSKFCWGANFAGGAKFAGGKFF